MAQKKPEKDSESIQILEAESDPPAEGSSNVVSVKTSGGKVIVLKRESGQEIKKEEELEKPDLRAFRDQPNGALTRGFSKKIWSCRSRNGLAFRGDDH